MSALKHGQGRPVVGRDVAGPLGGPVAAGAVHAPILPPRALTIKQPWLWAICHGGKQVENRCWRTAYRGPLALHASTARGYDLPGEKWLRRLGLSVPADREELPFGAIVATCRLVDIVPAAERPGDPHAFGPWCWVLADVELLPEPLPFPGKLRLWFT